MVDGATETTALQKPLVWLQSTCHRFRKTACSNLSSAQSSITAANPSHGFWKEAGVCLSCSSPGNIRRKWTEIDWNNSCPFPLRARLGRTNSPCFSSHLFQFWEWHSGRESQPEASPQLLPSCIFCTAHGTTASFPISPLQGPPSQGKSS